MKKLSIALITMALLSACGERGASPETGEKPPAEAGQADDAAQAAQASADAAAMEKEERDIAARAEAAAKRATEYKRALMPLVVASYAGECTTKAGVKSRSAVSVGADGTVSAPGMKASSLLDADTLFAVTRGASAGSAPMIGLIAGSEKNKWTVHLPNKPDDGFGYGSNDEGISCINASSTAQPKAGAVYPAVAKFFIAASATLKCNDYASLPKMLKITPSATHVTMGNETFPLMRAGEQASVTDTEKGLTYQTGVIDGEQIFLQLDQTGALSAFSVMAAPGPGKMSIICEPERP